jgi:hypothetical protein
MAMPKGYVFLNKPGIRLSTGRVILPDDPPTDNTFDTQPHMNAEQAKEAAAEAERKFWESVGLPGGCSAC